MSKFRSSRIINFAFLAVVFWRVGAAEAQVISAEGRLGDQIQASSAPALGWNMQKQGAFIVALAEDTRGEIWVGTEDRGVWRYQTRLKPMDAVHLQRRIG